MSNSAGNLQPNHKNWPFPLLKLVSWFVVNASIALPFFFLVRELHVKILCNIYQNSAAYWLHQMKFVVNKPQTWERQLREHFHCRFNSSFLFFQTGKSCLIIDENWNYFVNFSCRCFLRKSENDVSLLHFSWFWILHNIWNDLQWGGFPKMNYVFDIIISNLVNNVLQDDYVR